MLSSLEAALRGRVGQLSSGETSVQEFGAWFVPATWEIDPARDPISHDRASEICLRLAKYSRGHWTEAQLKDQLRPLWFVPASVP